MADLKLVVSGADAEAAADALTAILIEDETATVERQRVASLPDAERKVIDLIALASLVLSIPGAVLAVADLVQRMRKRKKAQALLEAARRLRIERRIEVSVLTIDDVPRPLDQLEADEFLAIAQSMHTRL